MARKATELTITGRGGLNNRPATKKMKMKKQELSKIMCRAWTIARRTGKTFAVALAESWRLYRLIRRMRAGVVRFAYEKTDGTLRRAAGTLHDVAHLVTGRGKRTAQSTETVRYYDVEAGGFRSFRIENLITIY